MARFLVVLACGLTPLAARAENPSAPAEPAPALVEAFKGMEGTRAALAA
jgi:hypothetical protein